MNLGPGERARVLPSAPFTGVLLGHGLDDARDEDHGDDSREDDGDFHGFLAFCAGKGRAVKEEGGMACARFSGSTSRRLPTSGPVAGVMPGRRVDGGQLAPRYFTMAVPSACQASM